LLGLARAIGPNAKMGANPMKDSAQNIFESVGTCLKYTTNPAINRQANAALFAALDSYPHHAFSPEGRRNVCRRFRITDEQLEATLLAYEQPGEYASEAERRAADLARVLGAIEAVVKPTPKRKAALKGKQKGGAKC
jgi:hypothetical protein